MNLAPRVSAALKFVPKNGITAVVCRKYSNVGDITTHTGQKWDNDDYRLVRFTNTPKQVNMQWAAQLIEAVPPKEVKERVVWCDGGVGPEGHPRIFINLDKPGNHSCNYCGLRFVKKDHH